MKLLFRVTTGSTYHRTNTFTSDVDLRSVYRLSLRDRLSPFSENAPQDALSLVFPVTGRANKKVEHTFFELSHFARTLAKCNPTAIEVAKAAIDQGRPSPASTMLSLAMDTENYAKQCNGFILGMFRDGKPKSLHHGWRVALHLRRYLLTGELDFDCTSYPEYDDLMRVKAGVLTPHERVFDKQEPNQIWHVQDLDKLSELVCDMYLKDLTK
jgi:hypothetical protein